MLNLPVLVEQWKQIRADILEAFPEIDEATLTDTLDGEAGALDAVAMLIRAAREDEAMAGAVNAMMEDMKARRERFVQRAESRRRGAQSLMKAIGVRKVERPDFTASLRAAPARVEIPDDEAVPDVYCVVTKRPNKPEIREALNNGMQANWARLSPGTETMGVRFK